MASISPELLNLAAYDYRNNPKLSVRSCSKKYGIPRPVLDLHLKQLGVYRAPQKSPNAIDPHHKLYICSSAKQLLKELTPPGMSYHEYGRELLNKALNKAIKKNEKAERKLLKAS